MGSPPTSTAGGRVAYIRNYAVERFNRTLLDEFFRVVLVHESASAESASAESASAESASAESASASLYHRLGLLCKANH